jgi:hypothetical protein
MEIMSAHEMEINARRLAIPCHILYMHVMFILYASYFSLIATVALQDDPSHLILR